MYAAQPLSDCLLGAAATTTALRFNMCCCQSASRCNLHLAAGLETGCIVMLVGWSVTASNGLLMVQGRQQAVPQSWYVRPHTAAHYTHWCKIHTTRSTHTPYAPPQVQLATLITPLFSLLLSRSLSPLLSPFPCAYITTTHVLCRITRNVCSTFSVCIGV